MLPLDEIEYETNRLHGLLGKLKKLMHQGDYLEKKSISNKSPAIFKAYKRSRNQINAAIRKAKLDYLTKEINKDSQSSWHT